MNEKNLENTLAENEKIEVLLCTSKLFRMFCFPSHRPAPNKRAQYRPQHITSVNIHLSVPANSPNFLHLPGTISSIPSFPLLTLTPAFTGEPHVCFHVPPSLQSVAVF